MAIDNDTDTDNSAVRSMRDIRRERKTNAILEATAQQLAERGYYNSSLDVIAMQVELTKGALYYYYPSKEDLVRECVSIAAQDLVSRLEAIVTAEGGPTQRLCTLIEAQLIFTVQDHPHTARLFRETIEWPEALTEHVQLWRQRHDKMFRQVIDEGIEAGEFAGDNVWLAKHSLYGAMNAIAGAVLLHPTRDAPVDFRALAERLLRLFRSSAKA